MCLSISCPQLFFFFFRFFWKLFISNCILFIWTSLCFYVNGRTTCISKTSIVAEYVILVKRLIYHNHFSNSNFCKGCQFHYETFHLRITKIFLMGPTGITKSNLAPYGSSGREWSITVTWSPTQSQDGLHLVCYSAEINNK